MYENHFSKEDILSRKGFELQGCLGYGHTYKNSKRKFHDKDKSKLLEILKRVKSLQKETRSRVQIHWVAPRLTQPFFLAGSIKQVPGISGNLVVKSKLPPCSGYVALRQLNLFHKKEP